MFGRRVFASTGVPRRVWPSLHIQSDRQAQRILPSLAPLPVAVGRQSAGAVAVVNAWKESSALDPSRGDEAALLSAAAVAWHCSSMTSFTASWCMPLRTIVWTLDSKLQHAFEPFSGIRQRVL